MAKKTGRKRTRTVTTRDIAERTGLSKMTVSRVLNEHPYVSAVTREKVMKAVRDLGFRPNTLAKRFFTGKTQLIGVVIPLEYMFSSFYFKELFQGVLECAEENDYDILLHDSTARRKPVLDKCLDLVKGKLAEGLLLAAPMSYDKYPLKLAEESVPLVMTGETACGDRISRVSIPNRASSEDAVRRLVNLGHRRIAAVTFGADHMESQEREQGYKDALKNAGIVLDRGLILAAHYNRSAAFRQVEALLKEHPDVTAVFAANADMAIGAADAIRAAGRHVPRDVSLVAFDDCVEMEQHTPPLSAVRQFPYKVGYEACAMLLTALSSERRSSRPELKLVDTEFMDRASMAPAAPRRGRA